MEIPPWHKRQIRHAIWDHRGFFGVSGVSCRYSWVAGDGQKSLLAESDSSCCTLKSWSTSSYQGVSADRGSKLWDFCGHRDEAWDVQVADQSGLHHLSVGRGGSMTMTWVGRLDCLLSSSIMCVCEGENSNREREDHPAFGMGLWCRVMERDSHSLGVETWIFNVCGLYTRCT